MNASQNPDQIHPGDAAPQDEIIFIPGAVRRKLLAEFPVSVRLRCLFDLNHFEYCGDLHSRAFSEFSRFRICGKRTLRELRGLVLAIQQWQPPASDGMLADCERLVVPANLQQVKLSDLALSTRLREVLLRKGVGRLGDLHQMPLKEIWALPNCGQKTVSELLHLLECAPNGELEPPAPAPAADPLPAHLQERFIIPENLREVRLSDLALSMRLRRVLEQKKVRRLGDLHDMPLKAIWLVPYCGRKTMSELLLLMERAANGELPLIPDAPATDWPTAQIQHRFVIPQNLHELSVEDLPLSTRLQGVLRRKGARRLGDLDGMLFKEIWMVHNCGRKTLSELIGLVERAAKGELQSPADVAWNPGELIQTLDAMIAALPERNREIVVQRLGGKPGTPTTLKGVGKRFHLTRERVRQIVIASVERMRRAGGNHLRVYLEHVERLCLGEGRTLTPERLPQWLEQASAAGAFNSEFYLRLLSELKPAIPVQFPGAEGYVNWPRRREIERALKPILRERFQSVPLAELQARLRTKAGLSDLESTQLLATVEQSQSFIVEHPQTGEPAVRLSRRSIAEVVKAVLQTSDSPMTPEQIRDRARTMLGEESAQWSPKTFHGVLGDHGFFLLAPRSYGLRSHFSLPEHMWEQAIADFRKLLKHRKRPISTREVISAQTFPWAGQTNPHELACILRQDKRLTDLGRFLFALTEWGMRKREHVSELILKVLRKAGRPLTSQELEAGFQQMRSVSRANFRSALSAHPDVRMYGRDHYGLKAWK